MQRSRAELEAMNHGELVDRVLEMQDMLREGLAVRDSLHGVLNRVLAAKEEEVAYYASVEEAELDAAGAELRRAWAAARHAVSNPAGLTRVQRETADGGT